MKDIYVQCPICLGLIERAMPLEELPALRLAGPCPFCITDEELTIISYYSRGFDWFRVRCCLCDSLGPSQHTPDQAVSAWNDRTEKHWDWEEDEDEEEGRRESHV